MFFLLFVAGWFIDKRKIDGRVFDATSVVERESSLRITRHGKVTKGNVSHVSKLTR